MQHKWNDPWDVHTHNQNGGQKGSPTPSNTMSVTSNFQFHWKACKYNYLTGRSLVLVCNWSWEWDVKDFCPCWTESWGVGCQRLLSLLNWKLKRMWNGCGVISQTSSGECLNRLGARFHPGSLLYLTVSGSLAGRLHPVSTPWHEGDKHVEPTSRLHTLKILWQLDIKTDKTGFCGSLGKVRDKDDNR